jgi:hypothetical protein
MRFLFCFVLSDDVDCDRSYYVPATILRVSVSESSLAVKSANVRFTISEYKCFAVGP